MSIRYYAIRQKSTNRYLPGGMSKGFTFTHPMDPEKAIPRLFKKKSAATRALKAWLKGKWVNYGSYEDGPDVVTKKVEGRDPDDMEIVLMRLTPLGMAQGELPIVIPSLTADATTSE